MILLLLCTLIQYSASQQPFEYKSATLTPLRTFNNGARVMQSTADVQNVRYGNQFKWNVRTQTQRGWHFIMSLDDSFGFDPMSKSAITITLNGPSQSIDINEFLFGFTALSNRAQREYISVEVPMNKVLNRQIRTYPGCGHFTSLGLGDIASMPSQNRQCDIAGGSCYNWENMTPFANPSFPLRIRLENDPWQNTLTLIINDLPMECTFLPFDFARNKRGLMKIYIAANEQGQSVIMDSIDILTQSNLPTLAPTRMPTRTPTDPSHAPSLNPTQTPTAQTLSPTPSPSPAPTNNPTPAPTAIPTNNPSTDPTPAPTSNPTPSPTNKPSFNPTPAPSHNPSQSPTKHPTQSPTLPSMAPSFSPTMPSFNPTQSPSNNPSQSPTKHPTNMPTKAPSFNPTSAPTLPSMPPTLSPTPQPVPAGYQWGAFGQLCPMDGYSLYNECQFTTTRMMDVRGSLQCLKPYDCCMCGSLECGLNGGFGCDQVRIGDHGAYGVKDIQILGNVHGVNGGAVLLCQGIGACQETVMVTQFMYQIKCDGVRSCQDAVITVNFPTENFALECTGIDSCNGLKIVVNLPGPPPGYMCGPKAELPFSKILCSKNRACESLEVTVNNQGCNKVVVDVLECLVDGACDGAMFDFIGDIAISRCACGPSCYRAFGLGKCFENLEEMICSKPLECMSQTKTILNPANGFYFACAAEESCSMSSFRIEISNDVSNPITHLGEFNMGGEFSAADALIVFDNQQKTQGLTIEAIVCSGVGSCLGTTFIAGRNVFIADVSCAPGACQGCRLKTDMNDYGRPCEPNSV